MIVDDMVERYMAMERSIILLVVTARVTFHMHDGPNKLQDIATRVGPGVRDRVVGVITSPDEAQSTDETLKLLKDQLDELKLRFGWHAVRNRSKGDRETGLSLIQRDENEKSFFAQGKWQDIPQERKGIGRLRQRLKMILWDHIKQELPGLIQELHKEKDIITSRIEAMGAPRVTDQEQRRYLGSMAKRFEHLTEAAINGTYVDKKCKKKHTYNVVCQDCKPFFAPFGDNSDESQAKRLRANIRAMSKAFAITLRQMGKTVVISDIASSTEMVRETPDPHCSEDAESDNTKLKPDSQGHKEAGSSTVKNEPDGESAKSNQLKVHSLEDETQIFLSGKILQDYYSYPPTKEVTRVEHEKMVNENLGRWLACQPRGEPSEAIFGGLFDYQSAKWGKVATNHLQAVWSVTTRFIDLALRHCVDEPLLSSLRTYIIDHRLRQLEDSLFKKLDELLRCHRHGNPGFYDGFVDIFTLKEQAMTIANRLAASVSNNFTTGLRRELAENVRQAFLGLYFSGPDQLTAEGLFKEAFIKKVENILSLSGPTNTEEETTKKVRNAVLDVYPAELANLTAARVIR